MVMREILRCHRQKPFDLIDVPDHLAEGLFTTLLPSLPVVTRLHTPYALLVALGLNNYRRGFSYWFIKTAEKLALQRSQIFYAPCHDLVGRCEELFALNNLPVKLFSYPLDLTLFSPPVHDHFAGPPRILFVGRLEQRKGIETIAMAFPQLWAQYPGLSLTLVGPDTPNIKGFASARQYLESAFAQAGCSDAVRFLNYVPLEQLPEILRAHEIVLVPSMYDNYPLVCLEAMACARAVVVSDAGGLPEMVRHNETGLIFEKGNAEALVRETVRLCESPGLRQTLGRNARAFCELNCAEDVIYQKNLELYARAREAKFGSGAR
jgi:glycosyltransferase involved in cell wall biosynthesis